MTIVRQRVFGEFFMRCAFGLLMKTDAVSGLPTDAAALEIAARFGRVAGLKVVEVAPVRDTKSSGPRTAACSIPWVGPH
jgi:arginase family enzyme